MANNGQDHEMITFKLSRLDTYTLYYCIIGTIVMILSLDWLTTFNGVWIWGMPRSAFGIILVGGIWNALAISIQYTAYKRYFEKLEKSGR